jgi:tRNA modification GTPase
MYDDTIAAIASPPGEGGIGIIRISGPRTAGIAGRIFRRGAGGRPVDVARLQSHHLYYGRVVDPADGRTVDEVMLARMSPPRTYTREEVVEIYCHGGPIPLRDVLDLVLASGARPAEPGEFTLRAFLNGRIDLSQAEAVMGVVSARTSESLRLAVDELRGRLSGLLGPARAALLEALAFLDASADFPEDEVPQTDLAGLLQRAGDALDDVLRASRLGVLYREGVQIAIVGRPNVGKSSLMNALLRTDRAIVTSIAGTTRDVISETINLRGIPATLLDTAGIAQTEDVIEQMGIARSRHALDAAQMALFVLDGSQPLTAADRHVAALLAERLSRDGADRLVIVINKRDLTQRIDLGEIQTLLASSPVVPISTLTGEGIDRLENELYRRLTQSAGEAQEPALVTLRQQRALERARQSTNVAREALADSVVPLDLIAVDVRDALLAVGEITGEQVSESVLNEIFSRFCIGK